MKLAFQGSRILTGQRVWEIIDNEVKKHNPDYVVTSGEADGVCRLAREYCERKGVPLKLHFLNNDKYAQGMYHHRSVAIIEECNYCVFIHDGKSKGTKNEMEIAEKLKKPNKYYLLKAIEADKLIKLEE